MQNYMYLVVYGALGIGQGNVELHVSWSVWGTRDRTSLCRTTCILECMGHLG